MAILFQKLMLTLQEVCGAWSQMLFGKAQNFKFCTNWVFFSIVGMHPNLVLCSNFLNYYDFFFKFKRSKFSKITFEGNIKIFCFAVYMTNIWCSRGYTYGNGEERFVAQTAFQKKNGWNIVHVKATAHL